MKKSYLSFLALFLLMITVAIDARPDPGRQRGSLVQEGTSLSPIIAKEGEAKNHLNSIKESEQLPNVLGYDGTTSEKGKKYVVSDFEPRPSVAGYDHGIGLEGKKAFGSDFEPRPSITDNDNGLEGKKAFRIGSSENFAPLPYDYGTESDLEG